MAGKVIKGQEIIENNALDNAIKDANQLMQIYVKTDGAIKAMAQNIQKVNKGLNAKTAGDLQKVAAAEKQATQAAVENERVKRAKIQTEKQLLSLNRQKEAAARKEIRLQEQLTNVYKRESKELNDLRHSYKNLAAQNKGNTKEAKALLREITRLDTKLKKIDKTVGQSQRNVGNYNSALGRLGGGLKSVGMQFVAVTSIIYGFARVITSSVRTFADFQQGSANLAAVLGKSRKDIRALTDDAKRLGSSTVFTASQVTELQVALSKLGFTEDAILKSTASILDLAAATGTDLAEAAEVTAQVMNGFNLEADETQRVVDVMAKSFTLSALDMQKFSVAMANVGPAARVSGLSIERTTAILGSLVDTGIDASKAGTDLRAIFQRLAKEGVKWDDAMQQVRQSTDKVKTATELFGQRAAVSGIIISENTDKLAELEKGLQNAGGAAEEMANTQLDTLSGATTRLSSAWEGFILSIESGDGVLGKALRNAVDLTTELVNMFTYLASSSSQWADKVDAAAKTGGIKSYTKQVKAFKELQEMSDSELNKLAESDKVAKLLFDLRSAGIKDLREQEVFYHASQVRLQTERIDLLKKEKDIFGFTPKQVGLDIESSEGAIETAKQELKKVISQLSDEEITTLLDKQTLKASNYGKTMLSVLETELQRRKDIKGEIIETNEEQGKGEKRLTGLAKLQKELTELEKKRSDYLVANGGVMDAKFYEYTNQVVKLEDQIKSLKSTLKERGIDYISVADVKGIDDNGNIELDKPKDTLALDNKEVEEEEEEHVAKLEDIAKEALDFSNRIIDQRIQALDRLNEAEQAKFDAAKSREEEIMQLRDVSAASQADSLAFEREEQAKALAEQEKIAKKKQRLELLSTSLDIMNSKIQAGDSNAVGSTLGDITALMSGLSALPAFWTGTDTTVGDALGLKVSDGRDGILARVDKDEMIMNKKKTDTLKQYGLGTTDSVVKSAISYQMGLLDNDSTTVSTPKLHFDNSVMTAELREMKQELKSLNRKPSSQIDIDKVGSIFKLKEKLTTPNTQTTKTKNIRLGR